MLSFYVGCLAERTEYVAKRCGFTYSGLRFSRAQTRWGSCNGKNGITLNLALLTLPKRLSDYVIVHELCHTEHHDHSPAFWKLVESIIPECRAIRKELKNYAYTLGFFK
ncbi:MAG: M48 family metallopeptidase [Christensenellales bacterium]